MNRPVIWALFFGFLAAAWLLLRTLLGVGEGIRATYRPGNMTSLSSVRSALQVYYGDHEGRFPTDDLSCLMPDDKYLAEMPQLWPPKSTLGARHQPTREVSVYRRGEQLRDTGKWAYFNDPADPRWGNFAIDCTHPKLIKGRGLFARPVTGASWSTF
ncbi:MAG: hypothetical protein M0011_06735 [Elusimicrobia bacterium]|nr:hypothetical protein [Elusimicrobiota bacterium]